MSEMETSTLDESQIESETRASYEGKFFSISKNSKIFLKNK